MKRILSAFVIFLLFPACLGATNYWHVNPDGTGDAPTIAAAIDSAASGDVILLSSGNYYEENLIVDGKDVSFTSDSSVPVLVAPTQGSGTAITFRNVSSSPMVFGLEFFGYSKAVVYENASPQALFLNIKECDNAIVVTGSGSSPEISYSVIDSCGTALSIVESSSVSFFNNTVVYNDVGVSMQAGAAAIERNIFYNCQSAVECLGGTIMNDCNDFWLNGTDYSGCNAGAGDIFADPIFCFLTPPSPGLYYPHADSPCLKANNSCGSTGENIGAITQQGCSGTSVEESSWGEIKELFK